MHIDLLLAHRFLIEQRLISCKHIQFVLNMCNWCPLELMFQTWMAYFDLWLFPRAQFVHCFDNSRIVVIDSDVRPQRDVFVLGGGFGDPCAIHGLKVASNLAYGLLEGYV